MDFNLLTTTPPIAEVTGDEIVIHTVQDALDLMATADYEGARRIMLHEKHLPPEFFDLSTRLAGEILQKYANYKVKLAIVGAFEKYNSNSLNAFIIESNRGRWFFFVPDRETAIKRLSQA